jgi:hypothetical protein
MATPLRKSLRVILMAIPVLGEVMNKWIHYGRETQILFRIGRRIYRYPHAESIRLLMDY